MRFSGTIMLRFDWQFDILRGNLSWNGCHVTHYMAVEPCDCFQPIRRQVLNLTISWSHLFAIVLVFIRVADEWERGTPQDWFAGLSRGTYGQTTIQIHIHTDWQFLQYPNVEDFGVDAGENPMQVLTGRLQPGFKPPNSELWGGCTILISPYSPPIQSKYNGKLWRIAIRFSNFDRC